MTILKVTIQPYITPSITASDGALVSTGLNASSYQWYSCYLGNYGLLNGQTTASYTPASNDYGSYAVIVVSSLGCADTTPCVTALLVGLSELDKLQDVRYYPNPVKNNFTVELSVINSFIKVEIYNSIAQLVKAASVENADKLQLSLPEAPGLYFAKIETTTGQKTIKLIKE